MEFNNNNPIYIQIYDWICDEILHTRLKEGERIQSVRELGAEIGVNPNTIMRTYEKLTTDNIIFNKRGIGYFIYDDAREKIISVQKEYFMGTEVPKILEKMKLFGIDKLETE